MDSPVKQSGSLDALDQFGISFEGLMPTMDGWAIGLRCQTCGYGWNVVRSSTDFQKEATGCPKAATSKKHAAKGPTKKA
ncbi:MAG: hypothetical protein HY293_09250 [Planctomycetes bacterium]|nr:hypothetical protein [Planctomycetota bacterium]